MEIPFQDVGIHEAGVLELEVFQHQAGPPLVHIPTPVPMVHADALLLDGMADGREIVAQSHEVHAGLGSDPGHVGLGHTGLHHEVPRLRPHPVLIYPAKLGSGIKEEVHGVEGVVQTAVQQVAVGASGH